MADEHEHYAPVLAAIMANPRPKVAEEVRRDDGHAPTTRAGPKKSHAPDPNPLEQEVLINHPTIAVPIPTVRHDPRAKIP